MLSDEGQCFYDLNADPYQQENFVGGAETALAGELARRLTQWNAATPWLGSKS
jgi:hypothetical protein